MRSCTDQHEARICTVTSICAYLTVYGLNLCRFLDEEAASFDFVQSLAYCHCVHHSM
jgi:hypothetical protein